MFSSVLTELTLGLALIAASVLLTRELYRGFRRTPVPGLLRYGAVGEVLTVTDVCLLVFGVAMLTDVGLKLLAS